MTRPRLEVADVFRAHGDAFLDRYGDTLSPEQRRVFRDIMACRTAALGGHVERCDRCGHQQIAYNSCRNRHCPKCQATAAAAVDGGPRSRVVAGRIFSCRLYPAGGARPDRPAEPAGGLRPAVPRRRRDPAADRRRPRAPRGRDRLPRRPPHLGPEPPAPPPRPLRRARRRAFARRLALGRLPAGLLPPGRACSAASSGASSSRLLRAAFDTAKLSFHGKLAALADPRQFQRRLAASAQTEWVVYAKPPFGGPQQVLKYLARYTHRVAISNRRLVALEGDEVGFLWKDYAHGGERKTMTLTAIEFIRRFLLHVLPSGFVRIRHYGFLANRVCQEKLELCRALLGAGATPEPVAAESVSQTEGDHRRAGPRRTPAPPAARVGWSSSRPCRRSRSTGEGWWDRSRPSSGRDSIRPKLQRRERAT